LIKTAKWARGILHR